MSRETLTKIRLSNEDEDTICRKIVDKLRLQNGAHYDEAAKTAFEGWDRQAPAADSIQHGPVPRAHSASVDLADFLDDSGSVYERVQEKRIGTFARVTSS